VGWVFIGVTLLNLYNIVRPGDGGDGSRLLGAVLDLALFGLPAAFLLKARSRWLAMFLFVLNVLVLVIALVLLVMQAASSQEDGGALLALTAAVLVFWGLLTWLSWRGVVATRALHRLRSEAPAAEFS